MHKLNDAAVRLLFRDDPDRAWDVFIEQYTPTLLALIERAGAQIRRLLGERVVGVGSPDVVDRVWMDAGSAPHAWIGQHKLLRQTPASRIDANEHHSGDARFRGSTGNIRLNQPIVGMAATRSGRGYWMVAADGSIFSFGGARFQGSAAGRLPWGDRVSSMAPLRSGRGYRMISRSGRVFSFGDVAASGDLAGVCPAICHLAVHIGDPHVRHMGTIGGSIANNDPAADYPAALLALGATVVTNEREIAAGDFFTGMFETALDDDEIITAVKFTAPDQCGYAKFPNPASRYALTGVFVSKRGDDVRVAVTGAGDNGVFLATAIEEALSKNFDPAALEGMSFPADDLMSDIHASAEYRANLVVVMAKRAVAAAKG